MTQHDISFQINGHSEQRSVPSNLTVLAFLREHLGLTGTKSGCDTGECGACTILVDGEPVNACLMLAVELEGSEVTTVEGLGVGDQLDPLQEAFVEFTGTQCGYCTPGILLQAYNLIKREANPNPEQIESALRGNLCRCTGYHRIVQAVQSAAREGA